jgi:hypothetical protein
MQNGHYHDINQEEMRGEVIEKWSKNKTGVDG